MGTMYQRGGRLRGMFGAGVLDEQEARDAYQAMAAAHKAVFEAMLGARKRIGAMLTAEQLRRRSGGR